MTLRTNYILFILLFAVGCNGKIETEKPTETPTEVHVAGITGSSVQFEIKTPRSWNITNNDTRYTIDPAQGAAGSIVMTLTANEDNPLKQSRNLMPLTFTSASGQTTEIKVTQRPSTVTQALFFFFIGTDLQSFFDNNIKDALASMTPTTPGEGRVAAFCRRNGKWCIVELVYDPLTKRGIEVQMAEYEGLNRNSPEFLTQIINDMERLVPAHQYGVVFGGHGTGWLPIGCSLFGPRNRYRISTAHAPSPDGKPYPITRYFGESGSMFDIDEIAASIATSNTLFHYIIFDDCFMSNIETLYTLRNSTEYLIASPCEIMGNGFPYHYVIPALFAENGTKSNLQEVCEKFHHYYLNEHDNYYRSGCIAMTVCSELEALAAATKRIYAGGTKVPDGSKLQIYEGLSNPLFYDFRQYMEQVTDDATALEAFREQFDRTFPAACRLNTPSFYSYYSRPALIPITYYSGVTCSAPSSLYTAENQATAWWQATH